MDSPLKLNWMIDVNVQLSTGTKRKIIFSHLLMFGQSTQIIEIYRFQNFPFFRSWKTVIFSCSSLRGTSTGNRLIIYVIFCQSKLLFLSDSMKSGNEIPLIFSSDKLMSSLLSISPRNIVVWWKIQFNQCYHLNWFFFVRPAMVRVLFYSWHVIIRCWKSEIRSDRTRALNIDAGA